MLILRARKLALAVSVLSLSFLLVPVWADCQSDYNDAMGQISKAKQKAVKGQKLDSNAFMASFQGAFDRLQAGGCVGEIMQILQHVQSEQQAHSPASAPQAPSP